MNTGIITLGVLLTAAAFIAGRSCVITERLRRKGKRDSEIISGLRSDRECADRAYSALATTLTSLQNPYTDCKRVFSVRQLAEGCYMVMMSVETRGMRPDETSTVAIPVKPFTDSDDPDFARREAEEFKEKCEEA